MKLLRSWLPVFSWMALIFLASTDLMSASHTSHLVEPLLRWLIPGISEAALETAHFFIRKAAHVIEYAILALLLGRAIGSGGLNGQRILLVFALAASYAASDEFHQSFVSSRGASVRDVGVDMGGAALGLFILWLLQARREFITKSNPGKDVD